MVSQEQIDRINELARKAKTPEGLTPEETEERAVLRAQYVAAFKASLVGTLDNTYVVDEKGNKIKVGKGMKAKLDKKK